VGSIEDFYANFLQTFRVKFNLLKRWTSNVLEVSTVRFEAKLVPVLTVPEPPQRFCTNDDKAAP
jgi:hypothetical protein